jgi:hypothetical protein
MQVPALDCLQPPQDLQIRAPSRRDHPGFHQPTQCCDLFRQIRIATNPDVSVALSLNARIEFSGNA